MSHLCHDCKLCSGYIYSGDGSFQGQAELCDGCGDILPIPPWGHYSKIASVKLSIDDFEVVERALKHSINALNGSRQAERCERVLRKLKES